jgi:hypothetical protein
METAASFEVRNAPSSYPTVEGLRRNAESAKMGRKRPHSDNTIALISAQAGQ